MNEQNEYEPNYLELELAHTGEIINYSLWLIENELNDYDGVGYQ